MKAKYNLPFLASIVAFLLGTSCCWLSSLAVWLGGATFLTAYASIIGRFDRTILTFAILLFLLGIIQLYTHRRKG